MTIARGAAADGDASLRDEEAAPLMLRALELSGGTSSTTNTSSSSSSSSGPWLVRARQQLARLTPELVAIGLVYFVQGILKLSSLAVTFFLKDELKLEPAQLALAETISTIPWTIKPLYGFITDSLPIRGMRRRPYLIIAGLLGSSAWLCMAALARTVSVAVACMTGAALATAFSDVVADSIVVQLARNAPSATEGALQSFCWSCHAFGRLITAYLSGWLVGHVGPRLVFLATASFPLIVCGSSCLINEQQQQQQQQQQRGSNGSATAAAAGGKAWAAATAVDVEGGGGQLNGDAAAAGGSGGFSPGLAKKHSGWGQEGDGLLPLPGFSAAAAGTYDDDAAANSSSHGRRAPALPGVDESAVLLASQHQLAPGQHPQHRHQHQQQQQQPAWSSPFQLEAAGKQQQHQGQAWGGSKHQQCLQEAWASLSGNVWQFWVAVRQPHMLRPVAFLFLLQACPSPDSAMFYFKTNVLKFDAEFFGRVRLVAACADLLGLAVYSLYLKQARLRPMMLWGGLLGCAVGLTPLLLVEGVNRRLGISDRLFALVDSALLASIGQVLMMPTLVMCARLCPSGVEATLYASLMSLNNAAVGIGSALGAAATKIAGITSTTFDHLTLLLLACNLLSLAPLPLVRWVPDETAAAAAAASAGQGPGGHGGSSSSAAVMQESEQQQQQHHAR